MLSSPSSPSSLALGLAAAGSETLLVGGKYLSDFNLDEAHIRILKKRGWISSPTSSSASSSSDQLYSSAPKKYPTDLGLVKIPKSKHSSSPLRNEITQDILKQENQQHQLLDYPPKMGQHKPAIELFFGDDDDEESEAEDGNDEIDGGYGQRVRAKKNLDEWIRCQRLLQSSSSDSESDEDRGDNKNNSDHDDDEELIYLSAGRDIYTLLNLESEDPFPEWLEEDKEKGEIISSSINPALAPPSQTVIKANQIIKEISPYFQQARSFFKQHLHLTRCEIQEKETYVRREFSQTLQLSCRLNDKRPSRKISLQRRMLFSIRKEEYLKKLDSNLDSLELELAVLVFLKTEHQKKEK